MSGNYLPRNTLVESLGHAMLKLSGWKIEGQLPALDKFVVIGAHHTSNWDFVAFLAAKFVLRLNARWFGKHTLFNGPLGVPDATLGRYPDPAPPEAEYRGPGDPGLPRAP